MSFLTSILEGLGSAASSVGNVATDVGQGLSNTWNNVSSSMGGTEGMKTKNLMTGSMNTPEPAGFWTTMSKAGESPLMKFATSNIKGPVSPPDLTGPRGDIPGTNRYKTKFISPPKGDDESISGTKATEFMKNIGNKLAKRAEQREQIRQHQLDQEGGSPSWDKAVNSVYQNWETPPVEGRMDLTDIDNVTDDEWDPWLRWYYGD